MIDQIVITFPEISDVSWSKILDSKVEVEIWDGTERKTYKAKWDGSRLSNEIKMWFDFPDELSIESDTKRTPK